jgi:hypothetical protein
MSDMLTDAHLKLIYDTNFKELDAVRVASKGIPADYIAVVNTEGLRAINFMHPDITGFESLTHRETLFIAQAEEPLAYMSRDEVRERYPQYFETHGE